MRRSTFSGPGRHDDAFKVHIAEPGDHGVLEPATMPTVVLD
jgi:hypothetical protein